MLAHLLNYLSEIMEDANDFSWQSAKASNAVLLCRMEEEKVEWSETTKIDKIRCTHAQRLTSQNMGTGSMFKSETKSAVCRFFQRGMCQKIGTTKRGVPSIYLFYLLHNRERTQTHVQRLQRVNKVNKERVGYCLRAVQKDVDSLCNKNVVKLQIKNSVFKTYLQWF